MLYFNHVTCYFNQGNERVEIGYNINYINQGSKIVIKRIHHPW